MRWQTFVAFALFVMSALARCEPAPAFAGPVTVTVEDDAELPATVVGQSIVVVGSAIVTRVQERCEDAEALAASATAQSVLERERLEAALRKNALLQECCSTPAVCDGECPKTGEVEKPWWARSEFWGGVAGGVILTVVGAVSLFIVSR